MLVYIEKSGDMVGCYHSGTDRRTNKQGKKELLSHWTMEGWDEQKHKKEIQPQILLVTKPMSSAGIIALTPPCWQIAQVPGMAMLTEKICQRNSNHRCQVDKLHSTGAKRWLDFRFITFQEFTWTRLKTLPSLRAPLSPGCREIQFIQVHKYPQMYDYRYNIIIWKT